MELLSLGAVVTHDRHRAGEAYQELVERAMRVFSPHLFTGHVEDHEVTPGEKRKPVSDLAGGEISAEISPPARSETGFLFSPGVTSWSSTCPVKRCGENTRIARSTSSWYASPARCRSWVTTAPNDRSSISIPRSSPCTSRR